MGKIFVSQKENVPKDPAHSLSSKCKPIAHSRSAGAYIKKSVYLNFLSNDVLNKQLDMGDLVTL